MDTTKLALPLIATALVSALATGIASPATAGAHGASSADGRIAEQCLDATEDVPPGPWRPAARLDVDATEGYLVVRSEERAGVCLIVAGRGVGILGGDFGGERHTYGGLTAARPFDYLTSVNHTAESIHFGIATGDVAALSLIGPDGSVTGAVLADGTFIVRTPFAEDSNEPTTNRVGATLVDGSAITGPFRS